MTVSAFPEWWRSKFQGLRTIALPAQLPLMDGDIAVDSWQWSHELVAAWYRLKGLSMICDTEITAEFDPVEALFVPGFREDFHAWWDAA